MPTLTNHKGFTLIEVLIALAILAIALTAVIEATSKNIQNTLYLQNKTIASWVGLEIINEAKINFLTLPKAPDKLEGEKMMLNSLWSFDARIIPSPNPHIQKIDVHVYKKSDGHLFAALTGYRYVE